MQHLKFFSLFQTLHEKEVPGFLKYLKLMHAGEEVAFKVFGYVKKFHPHLEEDDKKLELDYAYRKIFGQAISEKGRKNLLNTFSDLYLWLKDFLLQEKVRQDASIRDMLWLGILHERELSNEFSKSATRFYESKTASPANSMSNGITQIIAAYFQHQYLVLPSTEPDLPALNSCYQTIKEATDTICSRIDCERTHLSIMQSPQTDEISHLNQPATPLRKLYTELTQMAGADPIIEEQHFNQAFQILADDVAFIAPDERYMVIKYLRNFAARQLMRKNLEKYGPILRQINQFGLDNEAFTQKSVMSATEFTNIVTIASSAKDFDWAAQFILTKAHLLATGIRNDTVLLAKAVLALEQEKYKAVWQQLETVTFDKPTDYIRAKLLLMRAYYEDRPEHIDLHQVCDQFENWLYRQRKQKMINQQKTSSLLGTIAAVLGFVQIFKLLINERLEHDVLFERIHKTSPLVLDQWLLLKLSDYKARYAPRKKRI
ncbi:MAG: hypothetical protein WCR52_14370 [Bacteroidota bacterium]